MALKKYRVDTRPLPPRFLRVSRLQSIELDGCLGCLHCVKRESCIYDLYRDGASRLDPKELASGLDAHCINCLRCIQECKKNILLRAKNPGFEAIGDAHWTGEILETLWKQAETGRIPVSGTGYRGPFAGPGFDSMWTDMSEIVRPTRDGIHGRETISTVIELGRRPARLRVDPITKHVTPLGPHPRVEIPIPMLLETPEASFANQQRLEEMVRQAAAELQTIAVHASGPGSPKRYFKKLTGGAEAPIGFEVPWSEDVGAFTFSNPEELVGVALPLDEHAPSRASRLWADGVGLIRLVGTSTGTGFGQHASRFSTELVREVNVRLVEDGVREELTVLYSGGVAMAEHVAKIIMLGADGVVVDRALLVALECRLCPDCADRLRCPVDIDRASRAWGAGRMVNLIGSWHAQLIEVLGAMGLREVRRLRGELGRAMFFQELERDTFGPIFGSHPCDETSGPRRDPEDRVLQIGAERVDPESVSFPSRFRNPIGRYRVVRLSSCSGAEACRTACPAGVHDRQSFHRPRAYSPRSHLCRGSDYCRESVGASCVDRCPSRALRVGPDPLYETLGDLRWSSDLILATWMRAETGQRPVPPELERSPKDSVGGFDRIEFLPPTSRSEPSNGSEERVDLGVLLNRRNDERPQVRIGIPIYGGGMSYGSISVRVMLARARAYERFDSFTCTGEGGYPRELWPHRAHVITQVATGLFGVSEETIQAARIVEFKYAQGAKPGLGGHLLGDKVTPEVAEIREAVQGSALFSPFPFHSVYSVEDHKKHVDWIKATNPNGLVSVKVSTPTDVDMVAVGSYYAGAHIIHIDGSYGGTGAAPDIAKKNIAMPIEYAIPKVHRFLASEGVRDQMTLVASGGVRTVWDMAKAIALGADAVVVGTAELVALECVRCGACESGRGCPRGIATTDPELASLLDLDWATGRLVNLLASWRTDLENLLLGLGLKSIGALVGRTDLLEHLDHDREPSPTAARPSRSIPRSVREERSEEEGGCGVVGLASSVFVTGRHIREPSVRMHNRGNGKGGGIAACCLDPETLGVDRAMLERDTILQLALLPHEKAASELLENRIEEMLVRPSLIIDHKERLTPCANHRDLGLDACPPDVVRYWVRPKEEALTTFVKERGLEDVPRRSAEDELIYRNSFRINKTFYRPDSREAFVLSHGRNLLVLKIVGYAEQVVEYYGLEELGAKIWIAHQRYPTRGRVWHPAGSHPFVGLNEALVHNGDLANYHGLTEVLRQHDITPLFLTDTEAAALLFDLLYRVHGYPLELVIEALAPTTELDFERLPPDKKDLYRAIQASHIHGSPDGPWLFIVASSDPDRDRYRLIGITDTSMLRPQVFALQEGDVSIGIVASERQAIDATLGSLADEDARFRRVPDRTWSARGGSHTDGGAFHFTTSHCEETLVTEDKFGAPIRCPEGTPIRSTDRTGSMACLPPATERALVEGLRERDTVPALFGDLSLRVASFSIGQVRQLFDRIQQIGSDASDPEPALRLLSLLHDRRIDPGEMKASVFVELAAGAIGTLLRARQSSAAFFRVTFESRPPKIGAPPTESATLVVSAESFPPEGADGHAELLVEAHRRGWRRFVVADLLGHRFTGCGLGPATQGARIDVFGSSGDYLGSGLDGAEIHVHGSAQDQVGQILKRGKLVIHGDVGQTFLYGAKGGDAYVLGNTAGRPLINAVGRPRVVINGTCLDYLAESFMAGDPLEGGGFVVVNGLETDHRGGFLPQETPVPGGNLFSLASGGAIYVRDPHHRVTWEQLNGGMLQDLTDRDWAVIRPYLFENERLFGISVDRDLLTVDGLRLPPERVYRKVAPAKMDVLGQTAESW